MILDNCYGCCHENICNYKTEFKRAVFSVLDVFYLTENNVRVSLENSPIIVEFRCPHFLTIKGGERND